MKYSEDTNRIVTLGFGIIIGLLLFIVLCKCDGTVDTEARTQIAELSGIIGRLQIADSLNAAQLFGISEQLNLEALRIDGLEDSLIALDSALRAKTEYLASICDHLDSLVKLNAARLDSLENVKRGLRISWLPNQETDLAGYRVYCNDSLVCVTQEAYYDVDRSGVYAISAVDFSGNESAKSKAEVLK